MDLSKIRMKENIGMVINDTNTTQFSFIISPLKDRVHAEKNDYVCVDHPTKGSSSQILGIITEIRCYEQVAGGTIGVKVGRMMAVTKIIGYINTKDETNKIIELNTPPNPGSRVHLIYSEFLVKVFNVNLHGSPFKIPLQLGESIFKAINQKEDSKTIEYYLDFTNFVNSHSLISSMDTVGKTEAATILAEEINKKTDQPLIIFDPYGEYENVISQNKSCEIVNLTEAKEIKLEIISKIESKKIVVVTTKNLTPEKKRKIYSKYLQFLWNAKLEGKIPNFTLFIENPEKIDSVALEQIVYEGTKYGIAIILICKQPSALGTNIIVQMSTQIIGRTNDDEYLDYLLRISPKEATKITELQPNQWMVISDSQQPVSYVTLRKVSKK
ncbi:MAG: DUF87 domain-containing protein [Candidatus Bathyarchaeota archaeon]|nr:MAG: DUF87 domain-containing protein [Candidatus Bathyarchaeota archaeon]